ncbi:MAG TPA: family 43 glycosylhydrolase, partial [Paludibacter sp.]
MQIFIKHLLIFLLFLNQSTFSQQYFQVKNPAIPGFSPDPAFCRVGDVYYVANSTFSWFPGITIYKSTDLANWDLVGHALTSKQQLDLRHYEADWGIWAPDLTYDGKCFFMTYTIFNVDNGTIYEHNYCTTATSVEGPWTAPQLLTNIGIDPSIFHNADGKKYILTNGHIYLPEDKAYFEKNGGYSAYINRGALRQIFIQEINAEGTKALGAPVEISRGTEIQYSEGPRLYKHKDWYFLILAEGTTFWTHAVTIFRSKNIRGPYEAYSGNPILSAYNNPKHPLQKSGHAALVETPDGRCIISFLASRPLNISASKNEKSEDKSNNLLFAKSTGDDRRSVLGRETCFQEMRWTEDDWLVPVSGEKLPSLSYNAMAPRNKDWSLHFNFAQLNKLPVDIQSFCSAYDSTWVSLDKGSLKILGRDALTSVNTPSLLAVRLRSFTTEMTSCFSFQPRNSFQSAGITFFYSNKCFYYLNKTFRQGVGNIVELVCSNQGALKIISQKKIQSKKNIEMKCSVDSIYCSFAF